MAAPSPTAGRVSHAQPSERSRTCAHATSERGDAEAAVGRG
eukprot:CAMPEP_0182523826 /NCGR_PEP_ID=MMETSP1323-20130603/1347_1 /TAXON_ID=236787 /ORGANISM="Florenciella parvula, Strain RCC1693" /LENGTH=40 /DNA_ID= /DNA_START= /DNA_END= /DNA_ORIENTATION=